MHGEDLNYRDKKGNPNPVKFVSYIWKRIDGFIIDSLKRETSGFLRAGIEGDFKGRFVNADKAKILLGWKPKFTYEEAMKKYIKWFKENEEY